MMSLTELKHALTRLSLSETEASQLLSVDARTIRRWSHDPSQIPGPAEQALRAWLRLDELGLAWRPDGIPIGEGDAGGLAHQIALFRAHAIELTQLLDRVEARGGPAAPWAVDLEKRRATLGAITITYYATANGSFSPQSYSRRDAAGSDIKRDWNLIEDGFAAVANAIAETGPAWSDSGTRGKTKPALRKRRRSSAK